MNNPSTRYFFTGIVIAGFVLAILIFLPFLTPIILAVTLTVVFGPIYRFFLKYFCRGKEKSTWASLATLFLAILIVIIPAFFIVIKLYSEMQNVYYFLTEESGRSSIINLLNSSAAWISHLLFNIYPSISFDSLNVTDYLQQGIEWMFGNLNTLFTGVGRILMGIIVVFFALFYFLRDGLDFKRQVISLSPLGDEDDERIFKKLENAIYSIVAGSLVVGIIQGILTGIGFAIFHVPNPVLWGSMAAVAALIPGIGTSLVLVPGILYLFFTGSTPHAIGLLIWGVLAVGLIDNLLGPLLVNRGIKIHPFIILISVLGGLAYFGVVGFILGPIIFAFLFALLEIHKTSKI